MDDFDTSGWDLGIDWGGLVPSTDDTYNGGTLDPFFVDTTQDTGPGWGGMPDDVGFPYDYGTIDFDGYGIGNPLDDISGVYIPTTTPPAQTGSTPRTPTTPQTPRTPATTPPGSTPARPSTPSTSGNAASDLAKLVNSILQAIKGPQTSTAVTGQPAPVSTGGFDVGSLTLLGGGALIAWLVLRKK